MSAAGNDRPGGVNDPAVVESLKRLWEHRTVQRVTGEGLRDRKKRILRQQISDTATLMFLQRGFDEVKVSEIADACDVSEKTIYNYFPTKESLLFDREEGIADEIADAFGDRGSKRPLVDIALEILIRDVDDMYTAWEAADEPEAAMSVLRRFRDLIDETPSLQAALHGMNERLTAVAAEALAERAGVDPQDPEPQIAAAMLMALWRMQHLSMGRFANDNRTFAEVRDDIVADLRRAGRLAATGLSSFDLVVQNAGTKQQLQDAAEAANDARKQVIAAVKQARDAWKQMAMEARAMHDEHHNNDDIKRDQRRARQELRETIRAHQMAQREQHAEIRRLQMEAQAARRQRRTR